MQTLSVVNLVVVNWLTICLEESSSQTSSLIALHTHFMQILGLCLPCWLTGLLQGYRWPCQQDNPHTWHLACMCEGVLCVWVYVSYHETTAASWCEFSCSSNREQLKSHPFSQHHPSRDRKRTGACTPCTQSEPSSNLKAAKALSDMTWANSQSLCFITST